MQFYVKKQWDVKWSKLSNTTVKMKNNKQTNKQAKQKQKTENQKHVKKEKGSVPRRHHILNWQLL